MALQFTGTPIDARTAAKIAGLIAGIIDRRLDKPWRQVEVAVHAPMGRPTQVELAHQIWNRDHVACVPSPEGLPCLPAGTRCPSGSRLVEVSYVSRRSGGMGSYHQFDGYFVSAVVSPDHSAILDARIEKAY